MRPAVDSQRLVTAGNKEKQADMRIAEHVLQRVGAVVAAPVGQVQRPFVRDAHEARFVAARRTVESFRSGGCEGAERRSLDKRAIMRRDVVHLFDERRRPWLPIDRIELFKGGDGGHDVLFRTGNNLTFNQSQCASSQLSAARASTCSATDSCTAGWCASSITLRTTGIVASISPSGTSKTSSSCTCNSICAFSPALSKASSIRAMARRMMSAAEPWIGALIAARSLKARSLGLDAAIFG